MARTEAIDPCLASLEVIPHDQDFRSIVTQFVDASETNDPTERPPSGRRAERSSSEGPLTRKDAEAY
jgi:hypothetical protein